MGGFVRASSAGIGMRMCRRSEAIFRRLSERHQGRHGEDKDAPGLLISEHVTQICIYLRCCGSVTFPFATRLKVDHDNRPGPVVGGSRQSRQRHRKGKRRNREEAAVGCRGGERSVGGSRRGIQGKRGEEHRGRRSEIGQLVGSWSWSWKEMEMEMGRLKKSWFGLWTDSGSGVACVAGGRARKMEDGRKVVGGGGPCALPASPKVRICLSLGEGGEA